MHEKLAEEQGIEVKYSTLTRMLRQLGISKSQASRCGQVPDETRDRDAARRHRLFAEAGGGTPQSSGHPCLPALLQKALPEVLPLLQSLPDEVLSA
jgi:hypothetical protein